MSVRRQDCDSDAEYERIKRFDEGLPGNMRPGTMYYEEKLIGGLMQFRNDPHGPFVEIPIRMLSMKYDKSKKRLVEMERRIAAILEAARE